MCFEMKNTLKNNCYPTTKYLVHTNKNITTKQILDLENLLEILKKKRVGFF